MRKGRRFWLTRISFALALTGCFLLFQNMSPTTNESFDIRDTAPVKPEGYDQFRYFPAEFHGGSAGALGSEILDYNFGSIARDLEGRLVFQSGGGGRGPASVGAEGRSPVADSRLKVGLLSGDQVGFVYDNDLNLKCVYSAGQRELKWTINKNLSARSRLLLEHATEKRESSLQFSYQW